MALWTKMSDEMAYTTSCYAFVTLFTGFDFLELGRSFLTLVFDTGNRPNDPTKTAQIQLTLK